MRRPVPPAVESLERRDLTAAFVPGDLAQSTVIRYRVLPVAADFLLNPALVQAHRAGVRDFLNDLTAGTKLRFVERPPGSGPVDYTISIGSPWTSAIQTTGLVRHAPGGHGDAYTTLPLYPPGYTIQHEAMHALGFVHEGNGPLAPPHTDAEWAALDAFGAARGYSPAYVRWVYGPRDGVRQFYYDPASLMEVDPYRGIGAGLSPGDRQALRWLYG